MRIPSGTACKPYRLTCPFCESGELISLGQGFARCDSCGMPLIGSTLETLREVVALPDALGSHPCECGHPEMCHLPDGFSTARRATRRSCPSRWTGAVATEYRASSLT